LGPGLEGHHLETPLGFSNLLFSPKVSLREKLEGVTKEVSPPNLEPPAGEPLWGENTQSSRGGGREHTPHGMNVI